MNNLRLEVFEIGEKGEHYAHLPGIDMGSGRYGTTVVAWLPDGVILRNRGAKCWNGVGMGSSAVPATLILLKYREFEPTKPGHFGREGIGVFDEVEEVEYGRHYKAELEKMMAKALGVTAVSIERPPHIGARKPICICPSCGKRCRGFSAGLACTGQRRTSGVKRRKAPARAPAGLRALLP